MSTTIRDADEILNGAKPRLRQQAPEIQPFGHIVKLPIALSERACRQGVENLNQLLADTMTLRDLYKKHHWQVAGPTFNQLHLLFDKHYDSRASSSTPCRTHSASGGSECHGARRRREDLVPVQKRAGKRHGAERAAARAALFSKS